MKIPETERSWEANPESSPEKFNLKIVAALSDNQPYEFDDVLVWEDLDTGEFYWAADSGCSCPTPFEAYEGEKAKTLPKLTLGSFDEFEAAAKEVFYNPSESEQAKTQQFIQDVRMLLVGKR